MDGVRKCKEFLENLDLEELKSIRVKIKRQNIPEPDFPQPIYRGLDDPKSLVIHFRKETVSGIFDRKDIVLNAEFPDEKQIRKRRSSSRSESSEYEGKKDSFRHRNYRSEKKKQRSSSRSRKDSPRRHRSRSISPRKRSYSPRRDVPRRRSRSASPKPVKIPGLYIPPKSDYLRYEKRKKSRSPSPGVSHKNQSDERKRSLSPKNHASTKRLEKRRSRSVSQDRRTRGRSRSPAKKDERRPRLKSRSPRERSRRSRSPSRRNRSPRDRRYTSPSRPGRNKNYRHQDTEYEPHMVPCVFQDGEYWMQPGIFPPPGYMPRFGPPIMYPRYPTPMLMPRMPMPFMPRPRMYGPRMQSNRYQNAEDDRSQETWVEQDNTTREDSAQTTSVKISEIVEDTKKEKDS